MAPITPLIPLLQQRLEKLKLSSSTRPKVVISSCLQGKPVRYDGGHKSLGNINLLLADAFDLDSVCPEVAANMGTPRPPVHWVETNTGQLQLQQIDNPLHRFDQSLQHTCQQQLKHLPNNLDGAILKARSPSCGSATTPIFSEQNQPLRNSDGIWAATLKTHQPEALIIDENQLQTLEDTYWFIVILYNHKRLREDQDRQKPITNKNREATLHTLTLLNCARVQRRQLLNTLSY